MDFDNIIKEFFEKYQSAEKSKARAERRKKAAKRKRRNIREISNAPYWCGTVKNGRVIRPHSSKYRQDCLKRAARIVRYSDELYQRGEYKKCYDLDWKLW